MKELIPNVIRNLAQEVIDPVEARKKLRKEHLREGNNMSDGELEDIFKFYQSHVRHLELSPQVTTEDFEEMLVGKQARCLSVFEGVVDKLWDLYENQRLRGKEEDEVLKKIPKFAFHEKLIDKLGLKFATRKLLSAY